MKPSELMLKGFAMAGGRQCVGEYSEGDPFNPDAVCAEGAINLAVTGNAENYWEHRKTEMAAYIFERATDCQLRVASDGDYDGQTDPMPIDVIAGILAAEGH